MVLQSISFNSGQITMATVAPITSQRQSSPLIASAVFAVVAGVAVALRIVSKRLKKTEIDTSDYLIFAALVCSREDV